RPPAPSSHTEHNVHSSATYMPLLFFLMIRRPPRSTLFPTRRSSDLVAMGARRRLNRLRARIAVSEAAAWTGRRFFGGRYRVIPRSEEHTSELQSLAYLVCRLLLEKKKKTEPPTSSLAVRVVVARALR